MTLSWRFVIQQRRSPGGLRPVRDPVKRDQILNGAQYVFSRMGFDAASMNDITREYERGPQRGKAMLMWFLQDEVAAGTFEIEDVELAAYQFVELCMAGLFRRRIFWQMAEEPGEDLIERNVRSAMRVFFKVYGRDGVRLDDQNGRVNGDAVV